MHPIESTRRRRRPTFDEFGAFWGRMRAVTMDVLNRHGRALPRRDEAGDEAARNDADDYREVQANQRDEPEPNTTQEAHHGATTAGS